ncbi:MAG: hypothetical protein QOE51_3627 [Actinoplanes sp.]|jgi:hypothetical protein|nr:hypothetical protein [Actinoplanes sp.]
MPLYLLIPMLAGVALFGWVAGMWTHKRAERWCPVDGLRLECVQCRAGTHQPSTPAPGRKAQDHLVEPRLQTGCSSAPSAVV